MNLIRFTLSTREFGNILVLRPQPRRGRPWGDLETLKDTPWGALLPVVSGEALSHALHGHAKPLMAEIGTPPVGLCKKVPEGFRKCSMLATCPMASEKNCQPGPKLPDCYSPPGVDAEAREAVVAVALAWKEGRYVVIVEGDEFSL